MKGTLTIVCAALAALAGGCGSSGSDEPAAPAKNLAPVHGPYAPSIDAANFVGTVDNEYWPLEPGTTLHYEGTRGDTPQTDDVVVTHRTVRILGIPATVVRDTVSERGLAVERSSTTTRRTSRATSGTSARTPTSASTAAS